MYKLLLKYKKDNWVSIAFLGRKSVYILNIKLVDGVYYTMITDIDDNRVKWLMPCDNYNQAVKEGKKRLMWYGVKFLKEVRKTV